MENIFDEAIPKIFVSQVNKYKDKACISYKVQGKYKDISWTEMNVLFEDISSYLMKIGIKKGDRVGIFSPNRYEWWLADLSTLAIGAISVPIYATNSSEEAFYVLDHCEASICFAATEEHAGKILAREKDLKNIKKIIVFDDIKSNSEKVISLKEVYEIGSSNKGEYDLEKKINELDQKSMATIIYTSGTTGNPKGVMLSHFNLISNVRQLIEKTFKEYVTEDKIYLSFLPLSHVLERTTGYYMPLCSGGKVAFAEDFGTVSQNMQEVLPSIIISVPRLYEKIHSAIKSKVSEASFIKRMIFKFAMSTARKNLKYNCYSIERKGLFALRYKLFNKLVYKKLIKALGMNKLFLAVSGGGPLSRNDAEFFIGMGVPILEGFGLTETSPVTHVNRPGKIKIGTVGPPLLDTIVKLSDEGEILIKGPQVMMGYYKSETITSEAFTRDGFFKTGDIGLIDDEDYLTITGRIKDIIITAGGKNISPQNIENSLKHSIYIEQIAIVGDKRKYLSALIIPEFEEIKKWAVSNNISYSSVSELIENKKIVELFSSEIEKLSTQFSRVEQIKKFKLLDTEWTQLTGELTPSLKIKRNVVEEKYKHFIDEMYKE